MMRYRSVFPYIQDYHEKSAHTLNFFIWWKFVKEFEHRRMKGNKVLPQHRSHILIMIYWSIFRSTTMYRSEIAGSVLRILYLTWKWPEWQFYGWYFWVCLVKFRDYGNMDSVDEVVEVVSTCPTHGWVTSFEENANGRSERYHRQDQIS